MLWPLAASAEVATDGTLGAKVRLTGKDVTIPARLGQTRGKNLFHSFERFGIGTGSKVTFTGPDGLKNVIGRVTGDKPSKIDGTLVSRIPGADLWLLNPKGILFGPNAELDVPGSFHASTADELRFEDGKAFSALDRSSRVLSVAPPAAFGFLGAQPAGITVDRSVLEVRKGETLSLVGGNIAIKGDRNGAANDTGLENNPGTLRAQAGLITLATSGGPGKVEAGTGATSGSLAGTIRLSDKAAVVASGDGGGTIRIRSGRLVVEERSSVFADNLGAAPAAGGVAIEAETIELRDGGLIRSTTFGLGNAGEVTVTATGHLGIGAVGSEVLTGIVSNADDGSTGNAGRVTVTADSIDIRSGGVIRSVTQGQGNTGEVKVTAAGHLGIDAAGVITDDFTGINSRADDGPTGDAGRVTVTADTIELRRGGVIRSFTQGEGNAGEVKVTATGHLGIDGTGSELFTGIAGRADDGSTGDAGRVTVTANTIDIRRGAVNSSTQGEGNANRVAVTATNTIDLRDGGLIASTTRGGGNGGEVTVNAGHLGIDAAGSKDFTGIASRATVTSTGVKSTGDAGRVVVTVDTIDIRGSSFSGGGLSSTTRGEGDAGVVSVTADRLTIAEEGAVETNSETGGTAGNVFVQAAHLTVRDGGEIGSSGTGSGPAGNVQLDVDTLKVEDASIRTEGKVSKGGRIDVVAEDLISLKDAEITSSGILSAAGASVITLQAPLIALNDSRVTSLTGSGQPLVGSGLARLFGDVTVISADSVVDASSTVTLTGAEGDVGSQLVAPESVFLNVGNLLRESCAARRTGTASSFTAMGRGGLPPDPAGPLAGAYREPGGTTVAGQAGPVLAASFGEGCKAAPGG
jgi:filamentous hemagglutinin family protein